MYCRYVRCMLEYNSWVNVCCDDNTVQKSELEAEWYGILTLPWPHFFFEISHTGRPMLCKTISWNLGNQPPMFASISGQNSSSLRGDQNSVSFCSRKWQLHASVYACREKTVTQQRPVRKRFCVAQQKRQNGTSDVCLSIIPGNLCCAKILFVCFPKMIATCVYVCTCTESYSLLWTLKTTALTDDSDHVNLPPVKRKQVCLMYTEVKTTKGMCVVIGNNLS